MFLSYVITRHTGYGTAYFCLKVLGVNRQKKHSISDIIILAILATICGAESWDSIEEFGKTKLSFLKTFLKLPSGIPSHDTINRVFAAIGTQTKIAEKIIEQMADYILSVKGNQKELLEQVEIRFIYQKPEDVDETIEKGHGRIETRKCEVIINLKYLDCRENWAGIQSIIKQPPPKEVDFVKR